MQIFKNFVIAALFLFLPTFCFAYDPNCVIDDEITDKILTEVEKKNPEAISGLRNCFKFDHSLMLKAATIDPSQFQFAADILQSDENFVYRITKVSPSALKYASPKLRSNPYFMERATYLSRDSLKFATPVLTDNKLFMRRMISIDSLNYKFASDRLKELPEFAKLAFNDDGLLLEYAPKTIKENKDLVRIAFNSNNLAIKFAAEELQQEKEFQFKMEKISDAQKEIIKEFVQKNYVTNTKQKNLLFVITNKAKNFHKQKIIDRNYIVKWRGELRLVDELINKELHLITATSRNYPILWKKDFHKYPDLIKKIENFLKKHNIDQGAIDSLSTTFFWKIKDSPATFAFNLYLLRDSNDTDFGPEFSNVTSLTAIVQKRQKKWEMTVIEVIFDTEIKTEVGFENGHKKYVLWDLYKTNKDDKKPKIIFKVEDRFKEHFEIFEEQSGGKYKISLSFEPSI